MPPARKRPRTYDPAKTRTAVLAQFGNVREAVRTLTAEQLALPTRLGDWTVRDLVAHITMAVESVSRDLERPEPAKAGARPCWTGRSRPPPCAGAIAEDTRGAGRGRPRPRRPLRPASEQRLTERLAAAPRRSRLLATRAGGMRLDDYLVTRTVELVVHTDDLNAAVPASTSRTTARPSPPAPGCSPTPSPRRRPAARPRCGSRRTPSCSAWRGRGTPGAPRPTSSRPTR